MASPQWKNFQPPIADPAILAYHRSASMPFVPGAAQAAPATAITTNVHAASSNNLMNNPVRETGIIEKICHSYGFIQCCDRDARLFFHFSQYNGNVETMNMGDHIEFQMSYDRKTSKPIACSVVKLINGTVSFEVVSDERVTGTVVAEARAINRRHSLNGIQDGTGQLSYERNGECFFLPFTVDDLDGDNVKVKVHDNVTFFVATDKRSGMVRARKVRPLEAVRTEKCAGVVCSLKENFGFIERSDVVKEIFFHYSAFKGNINELELGDDVEFEVQTRNNKEVATDIKRLAPGTVIFEDVSLDRFLGRVVRTLKCSGFRRQSDPLAGRIVYETKSGQVEIPYGDKDQRGEYTLQVGDKVEFNIATDRRDKLQRGTDIDMLLESFALNSEQREQGYVATLRDGYGFIRCVDREGRMFFHFSEVLGEDKHLLVSDELEFTVVQDPNSSNNTNREVAVRIQKLTRGSITVSRDQVEKTTGYIDKEPPAYQSPMKNGRDPDGGSIVFDVNGNKHSIPFQCRDLSEPRYAPKYGDKVEFQISENKKTASRSAANVKLLHRSSSVRYQGFVATIKEAFGFIETADHDKEVFFHFSAFDGEPGDLDLGDEVEYALTKKTAKVSAEYIKKLPKGTVNPETVELTQYDGKVVRPMRIINPDQEEYTGLVQLVIGEGEEPVMYPFGITSLVDKRDFLQKGDVVRFQLATVRATGKQRATGMVAVRKMVRATVDSVKGQFGFLTHEMEPGKKLFFHMTEVQGKSVLRSGDDVEFVIVHNQRNGKYSATNVRKISIPGPRPQRLMSRLKSVGDEGGPKLVVIRQPRGPDGTKGFKPRCEA